MMVLCSFMQRPPPEGLALLGPESAGCLVLESETPNLAGAAYTTPKRAPGRDSVSRPSGWDSRNMTRSHMLKKSKCDFVIVFLTKQ